MLGGGFSIVFLALTEAQCGVESYFPQELLPGSGPVVLPMHIGTRSNLNTSIPLDTMDLTGIWWLRWTYTSEIPWLLKVYSELHFEELASFASTQSNVTMGKPMFPARLTMPSSMARQWAFSTTIPGRFGAMLVWLDPNGYLTFRFSNASHAWLGSTWYMDRIDEDRWLRTTIDPWSQRWYYQLTRIILEDGTPHPEYWPLFVKHMSGAKIRVRTNSNYCMRQCGVQRFGTCPRCESECGL